MADVQLENGYVRIANQLLEALSISEFTAAERRLLDLLIRLSYGCRKKTASFPQWKDLTIIGIDKSYYKKILTKLEINKVIYVDWKGNNVMVNKHFDQWKIRINENYSSKLYHDLLAYNLSHNNQFTAVESSLLESNSILPESNLVESSRTQFTEKSNRIRQISRTENLVDACFDKPGDVPKDISFKNIINNESDKREKVNKKIKRYCPSLLMNMNDGKKNQIITILDYDLEKTEDVMKRANQEGKGFTEFLSYVIRGLEHYDEWYGGDNPAENGAKPVRYATPEADFLEEFGHLLKDGGKGLKK